jgi:hypothetical protein
MHVKKSTNACKETYSSTPLTDYRSNQRLLRTRICITFCAFTSVHGVYASPFFFSVHSVYGSPTKDVEPQEQIQRERALCARDTHFLQSTSTHTPPLSFPPPNKLIPSPHCMSFATAGAATAAPQQLSAWEQAGRCSGSAAREREREAETTTSSRYILADVC